MGEDTGSSGDSTNLTEQRLRESEARLELATRAAGIGIWDWDLITNTFVYSDRAKAICGFPPDKDVTYEDVLRVTHRGDSIHTRAAAERAFDPAIKEKPVFEYRIIRDDGELRWVVAHGDAVFETVDGEERAVRFVGTLQDITERKVTEEALRKREAALRESEARFRAMADSAPAPVWMTGAEGGIEFVNQAFIDVAGGEREALFGDAWTKIVHPDDLQVMAKARQEAWINHDPYAAEARFRDKEGRWRWMLASSNPRRSEDGTFAGYVGMAVDLTDIRETEAKLRASEALFREVADVAPVIIWMSDETKACTWVNKFRLQFTGRTLEQELGTGWVESVHPDDMEKTGGAFFEAFDNRAPYKAEYRMRRHDGQWRFVSDNGVPRYDPDGLFLGYIGSCLDVTEARLARDELERVVEERTGELAAANRQLVSQIEEREKVEATLRQMQRLEAVGQLTSGVAHDFNNLLTVVLGNVNFVERAVAKGQMDEKVLDRLGYVKSAAERGATLTAQLLAFSRRQRLEAKAIDLNETVANMRDLLQSSMGGSVRLETVLHPELWPALVDPTQIELVILNLAINSRDAMEVGGSLTVETANVTLGEPERPEEPPAGEYVMISVADTGPGMTEEVFTKAFEPFFTTKPVGKGSGLGLAQVYGFAKQSGGGVRIDTRLGEGTVVKVFLPRAAASKAEDAADAPAPDAFEMFSGGRRVMLVDDDSAVREVTAAILEDFGCEVVEAGSGGAALDLLERDPEPFDLMVVDFAMPGMNGAEVAREVATRKPGIPVLFITGYADLTALREVGEDRVVQKPFKGDELAAKVRRLLGASATSTKVVPLRR